MASDRKPTWTPGPWTAIPEVMHPTAGRVAGRSPRVIASNVPIAKVERIGYTKGRNPEAEANAHLIASAPSLYEALEECIRLVGKMDAWTDTRDEIENIARAALRLARGQ